MARRVGNRACSSAFANDTLSGSGFTRGAHRGFRARERERTRVAFAPVMSSLSVSIASLAALLSFSVLAGACAPREACPPLATASTSSSPASAVGDAIAAAGKPALVTTLEDDHKKFQLTVTPTKLR